MRRGPAKYQLRLSSRETQNGAHGGGPALRCLEITPCGGMPRRTPWRGCVRVGRAPGPQRRTGTHFQEDDRRVVLFLIASAEARSGADSLDQRLLQPRQVAVDGELRRAWVVQVEPFREGVLAHVQAGAEDEP